MALYVQIILNYSFPLNVLVRMVYVASNFIEDTHSSIFAGMASGRVY